MDFEKLIKGVVALSNFLIARVFWLSVTVVVVWCGFSQHAHVYYEYLASSELYIGIDGFIQAIVDKYKLSPLLPGGVVVLLIFALNENIFLLRKIGEIIPPGISFYRMPGISYVSASRLSFVLSNVNPNIDLAKLIRIVEVKGRDTDHSENVNKYYDLFKASKGVAVFSLVSSIAGGILGERFYIYSVYISVVFAAISLFSISLIAYHAKRFSFWQVEKIFDDLMYEHAIDYKYDGKAPDKSKIESQLKEYSKYNRRRRNVISLYFPIPFIESLGVLGNYGGDEPAANAIRLLLLRFVRKAIGKQKQGEKI
ncbi:hypothetical protein ELH24_09885 [Rhizobium ruizarguesonis]|uniref:hypothetical protein n=1 Tax=Rhizobium ruizarguesonis TaxID=2081791 RepID=UPI001031E5BB|nr:hypothetical protein [Rhizobium ruizarguesonis]TBC98958.1 hypothetical protein ELH25_09840 [Rhizobium ruizarguesonis]TBD15808.1 hypothetical protein ELH24_09885 [Rhizobium ruizarguesonis]TBD27725.1 hypothetical protein ELH20_09170 [Rhizobium ruizarguesonis]TBE32900.1 hypothetical protein ELH07_09690 [Rhizobium ruizarguesonis]TBE96822.1 hypothetical protein ELG98_09635 [Rhizobium ruizarguesonis]